MHKHHLKFWFLPSLFTLFLVINFTLIVISFLSYRTTQYHRTVHLITDSAVALIDRLDQSEQLDQKQHQLSDNIAVDFSAYPHYSKTIYFDLNSIKNNGDAPLHKAIRKSIMLKLSKAHFLARHLSICYDHHFCANFTVKASEKFYLYLMIALFAMSLVIIIPWYFFCTQKLIVPFLRMKKIASELDIDPQLITYNSAFNFKNMAEIIAVVSNKLTKINEEKLQIFAAISHDIKTPITKAILYTRSNLLPKDQHALQKYFDDMDYLLNQIQIFAKKSYFEETFHQVNLSDLIESICHEYQDVGFDVQCITTDTKPCILTLQRKAFKRVLQNLIDNALKYAGDAQVKLTNAHDKKICLEIIDSGSGIAEDKLAHIFEPFYRIDLARNHRIPGSGLGLAIVKEIITKNNAHINIKNRTDTHGLIVRICWRQ
ncbi:sensor histidine kinase [Cysteiniphilum sp. 6C5]|uniref:sensor histidine kinase n=1 Tax=unclassified Cysteiniphilum TaxID=2610889 RepID=UPI003F86CC08